MDMIIVEYENVLIGRQAEISTEYFNGRFASASNQIIAIRSLRFIIEKILRWTPEQAKNKFDRYTIKFMHLERFIEMIEWPNDVVMGDPKYVLSLIYPNIYSFKINKSLSVSEIINNVIENKAQYPRDYFIGEPGLIHFAECLRVLINDNLSFDNIFDLYKFFNSPQGNKWLTVYKLRIPLDQFSIDLNYCLYKLTENDPNSKFLYNFYKFNKIYKSKCIL